MRKREKNGEYLTYYKQYYVWEKDTCASPKQKQLDKQAIKILT
jgi:hypothetical protein